jgi:predicted TIM-barrel fold metal-dependent hydrolase
LLAGSYEQVHELARSYIQQFSEAGREKIMGRNAAAFYGVTKSF